MTGEKNDLDSLLKYARLQFEKCDLEHARETYALVLKEAARNGQVTMQAKAITGLLRYSAEAMDSKAIEHWDQELKKLLERVDEPPIEVWYCKGTLGLYKEKWLLARRYMLRHLRAIRRASFSDEREKDREIARSLVQLIDVLKATGKKKRARVLAELVLKKFEAKKIPGINGIIYWILGRLCEENYELEKALQWYQRAHGSLLEEHNWFHHLYVIYAYARIARHKRDITQARWFLDLVGRAVQSTGFNRLRVEVEKERNRLEKEAIDIIIDSRRGSVKTREGEEISLRKQYILMDILKALSSAHRQGDGDSRGLSKSEIIHQVWKESYRPEAHDNKLYYNINRLRRLIEPNARHPQYVQNWKEGYRFAPGLRVKFLDSEGNELSERKARNE